MANPPIRVRFARGRGPNAWDVFGGYRKFLRDPAILKALTELGEKIHDDAGGDAAGFRLEVDSSSGARQTPRVAIIAASFEAKEAEAVNRVLTRAVENNRES